MSELFLSKLINGSYLFDYFQVVRAVSPNSDVQTTLVSLGSATESKTVPSWKMKPTVRYQEIF